MAYFYLIFCFFMHSHIFRERYGLCNGIFALLLFNASSYFFEKYMGEYHTFTACSMVIYRFAGRQRRLRDQHLQPGGSHRQQGADQLRSLQGGRHRADPVGRKGMVARWL